VSRSEADGKAEGESEKTSVKLIARPRRDDMEFNELDVRLRISYKTLVLIFVLFDVFHKVANVLVDSNSFENFFPWN